jgi:hypothetical protein
MNGLAGYCFDEDRRFIECEGEDGELSPSDARQFQQQFFG